MLESAYRLFFKKINIKIKVLILKGTKSAHCNMTIRLAPLRQQPPCRVQGREKAGKQASPNASLSHLAEPIKKANHPKTQVTCYTGCHSGCSKGYTGTFI